MNIAYDALGGINLASSRLRVYYPAWQLARRGHKVTMLSHSISLNWRPYTIMFQKRSDGAIKKLIESHRMLGAHIVVDCDDWLPDMQEVAQLADVVTVDTPAKLELFPNAVVIPDALDVSESAPLKTEHNDDLRRVVWFGNLENKYHADIVNAACCALNIEFHCISTGNWFMNTIDHELIKYDLAVCPYVFDGDHSAEWINSKSANRPLKSWALGLPVAGTPIPSYIDVGLQYQAQTLDEWVAALTTLRDPALRAADAARGRDVALQYSADKIAVKWLEVFNNESR